MADRIVVMHDGIVEQVGEPLELYDQPKNMFVAGFIGSPSMNFINGTFSTDQGPATFQSEGGLRLPVGAVPTALQGRRVTLGVRPEHVLISSDGVPAEVIVVEPTGSETQVNVKNGPHELVCLFRERIRPRPGETIRISPMAQHLHVFDAESGQRISA